MYSENIILSNDESWPRSQVVQKYNIIKLPHQSHHNVKVF
jgi:hypothetical protein